MPDAFLTLWTLQRACDVQLATLSMGAAIPIGEAVARKSTHDAQRFRPAHSAGQDVFDALVRQVDRMDAGYRD